MVTLRESHREARKSSELESSIVRIRLELRDVTSKAREVEPLKAALKKARTTSAKHYSANYSARKEVENLKAKKQTVLKAVITLILDGLLAMTDDELQERYFVDIGNIVQTRNTIKRSRR